MSPSIAWENWSNSPPHCGGWCVPSDAISYEALPKLQTVSGQAFVWKCVRHTGGQVWQFPNCSKTVTTEYNFSCIALHNFMMSEQDSVFNTPSLTDRESIDTHAVVAGDWRQNANTCFTPLTQGPGNRNISDARLFRNELKDFVNDEGKVSWQEDLVFGRVFWKEIGWFHNYNFCYHYIASVFSHTKLSKIQLSVLVLLFPLTTCVLS